MSDAEFPAKDQLTVQFAHVAYQFEERFAVRNTGIKHFQTWSYEDTLARACRKEVSM